MPGGRRCGPEAGASLSRRHGSAERTRGPTGDGAGLKAPYRISGVHRENWPAFPCQAALSADQRYALPPAFGGRMPTGGRRSKPSPRFFSVGDALSLRFAQRCRSEDRRSQPSALSFKWWRRRESNPRPKVFCNDVYMHIRVVGGNPRPEAPFPLSVPHRINPANRGSEPIPCAHRRLGKTAGKARLCRRPFPPGRRGQEERGYLSSQCQFSVGFCFVSTVYERWTPDMQSLLHVPSSNPVRPLLARFRRQVHS